MCRTFRGKYETSAVIDEDWEEWLMTQCRKSVKAIFESTIRVALAKANNLYFNELEKQKTNILHAINEALPHSTPNSITLGQFTSNFIACVYDTPEQHFEEGKLQVRSNCIKFFQDAENAIDRHIFEYHNRRDCTTEQCSIL